MKSCPGCGAIVEFSTAKSLGDKCPYCDRPLEWVSDPGGGWEVKGAWPTGSNTETQSDGQTETLGPATTWYDDYDPYDPPEEYQGA